MAWQMGSK